MIRLLLICVLSLLCFDSILAANSEKLIFALDIIRHGDRTSESIPSAPHEWNEGVGQLTAEGMQQEFQLGTKLRKKYIEDTHLLPMHYSYGTLFIRSTDFDRTLMSAQSFLMGLYPLGTGPALPTGQNALPQGFQPIPIHTQPLSQESELTTGVSSEEFYRLLEQYVFPSKEWQDKTSELKSKFLNWSRLTGVEIDNLLDVSDLADRINVYQKHHIVLPTGLSEEDANQIVSAGQWADAMMFKSKEMGKITGKKLIKLVANYIQQASEAKSSLKYVLLSGHDTTILRALSAMQAPLDGLPPYASDLNFSLYTTGANNYYVKVSFNDAPVFIPQCGSTMCSLPQFMTLIT